MLSGFLIRVLNEQKEGFAESERLTPLLRNGCAEFDIDLRHAGDYFSIGSINEQVLTAIERADVVIADVNSENENVWYEVGYADRVLTEKVICISNDSRQLPFDRQGIRSVRYAQTDAGYATLPLKLRNTLADFIRDQLLQRAIGARDARLREEDIALTIARRLQSPNLRKIAREWLQTAARDTNRDAAGRRVAIRALSKMEELTDELIKELARPVEDPQVRASIYEQLYHLRRPVDAGVWNCAAQDLAPLFLLTVFARAAARHWLDGKISEQWLRERVGASSDANVRRAVLAALQELVGQEATRTHGQSSTDPAA